VKPENAGNVCINSAWRGRVNGAKPGNGANAKPEKNAKPGNAAKRKPEKNAKRENAAKQKSGKNA
jgi:hypothetical protein